ncbi:MAG: hypothetical protein HC934_04080 [Acaryochloridaceae cyanobacterium SU_2_1]|nr:hypothetical protein [Acaryochloridaceae cyanobacterium SU_2_1]NJM95798.1 hypothetical protein [Acaryochloridaceae cyanobacterium CSU_5_19]
MNATMPAPHPNQSLMQSIAVVYQRYLRGEIGIHRYSCLVDELIEQYASSSLL